MFRLRTLGGLAIYHDAARLESAPCQRKALAVLSVLAEAGSVGVPRERLAAVFWGERDTEHARGALKQTVHILRGILGSTDALPGTSEICLNPAVVESDLSLFRDALTRGDDTSAVREYAGPFLDGVHVAGAAEFERWAEVRRESVKLAYAGALERLARDASMRFAYAEAVALWRRVQAVDLLNGSFALGLMTALDAAGDRASAIRHASLHATMLREEIGATPDTRVAALAERLRDAASEPHAYCALDAAPTPRSAQCSSPPETPHGRSCRLLPPAATARQPAFAWCTASPTVMSATVPSTPR